MDCCGGLRLPPRLEVSWTYCFPFRSGALVDYTKTGCSRVSTILGFVDNPCLQYGDVIIPPLMPLSTFGGTVHPPLTRSPFPYEGKALTRRKGSGCSNVGRNYLHSPLFTLHSGFSTPHSSLSFKINRFSAYTEKRFLANYRRGGRGPPGPGRGPSGPAGEPCDHGLFHGTGVAVGANHEAPRTVYVEVREPPFVPSGAFST